jgi:flagellar hook-length control protein FliK
VIPTVESLPTVSGQDGSATNLSKTQSESGFDGNRKPFGDVLSSQESSVEGTKNTPAEKELTQDSGKELLSGGKDLPDTDAEPVAVSVPTTVSSTDELAKAVAHQNFVVSQVNDSSAAIKGAGSNVVATEANAAPVPGTVASLLNASSLAKKELQGDSPLPVSPSLDNEGIAGGEERAAKTSVQPILNGAGVNGTGLNNSGAESAKALRAANSGAQGTQFLQPGLLNEADVVADSPPALLGKESSVFEAIDRLVGADSAPLKSALPQVTPLVSNTAIQTTSSELQAGLKSTSTTLSMTSSLGDPGWDGEFVGRVNMVVKGGLQEARIQLSPPELGRLDIKVSTEGDTTKVMFAVDNVAAREAIEQAMPRLRELLEQGGLQLSHAEVADHSQSRQGQGEVAEGLTPEDTFLDAEIEGEGVTSWQLGVSASTSTVDYYI